MRASSRAFRAFAACLFLWAWPASAVIQFGPPQVPPTTSTGGGPPHIVSDGSGGWIVVRLGARVTHSADGENWSPLMYPAAELLAHRSHLATDGAENWVVVFEIRQHGGGGVASSNDRGATWSAPIVMASTAWDIDDVRVATDGAGNWIFAWSAREISNDDYEMWISRSVDNGQSWTSPVLVDPNGVTNSLDDSAPDLVMDKTGAAVLVWEKGPGHVGWR